MYNFNVVNTIAGTSPVDGEVAGVRGDGQQRVLVRVEVGERRDAPPRASPRSHAQLRRRAPVPDPGRTHHEV